MKATRSFFGIGSLVFWPLIIIGQMSFTDVTIESGIDHQFKVYEGMFGGGVCVFDVDKDGYEDLFITSGINEDVLYHNQGDGTFKNIYEGSGLEVTRSFVTQGVAGADVNRDGWIDLFITTITSKDSIKTIPREKNLFFINNGDNTFRDATEEYGVDKNYSFSTAASFGDFNADGYPDLYVGNYFLEYDGPLTEINDATIVNASRTAEDVLYLNMGGKYFKNVYEEYGLNHRGFGFGGVFTDYDNDGDQDLLVNNDFGYKAKPNYLLRNELPKKKFTYVEKETDMDLRINAMGAAVGDYNQDGFLDYFVTNIKFNRFMVQKDSGHVFADKARPLGTSIFTISWGANFADFDHDGDMDLYVANGDLNPNCTPMGNYLFENKNGKYVDEGRVAGAKDFGVGRGSAIFDIENDGDMDILIVNQEPIKTYPLPSRTVLLRNDSTYGNWLKVKLKGLNSDLDGLGSRVRIVAGGLNLLKEVDGGGSSHLSQNSKILHFGLGQNESIDSLIVTWNGGVEQILLDQKANTLIVIKEVVVARSPIVKYLVGAIALFLIGFIMAFNYFGKTKNDN